MSKIANISEPTDELEHLIADLSKSGELIFVFGDGLTTAHLAGTTTPEFGGPADRRWWHVKLGDDAASWTMSVRVDQITRVRFFREPYPFQLHFPGRALSGGHACAARSWTVQTRGSEYRRRQRTSRAFGPGVDREVRQSDRLQLDRLGQPGDRVRAGRRRHNGAPARPADKGGDIVVPA